MSNRSRMPDGNSQNVRISDNDLVLQSFSKGTDNFIFKIELFQEAIIYLFIIVI